MSSKLILNSGHPHQGGWCSGFIHLSSSLNANLSSEFEPLWEHCHLFSVLNRTGAGEVSVGQDDRGPKPWDECYGMFLLSVPPDIGRGGFRRTHSINNAIQAIIPLSDVAFPGLS